MKTLKSAIAVSLTCLIAMAAPKPPQLNKAEFKWSPDPAEMGGLSTNDYYTNIVFTIFSSPSANQPTNNWPAVTNWLASTFPSRNGIDWSNTFTIDGNTRFFIMTAGAIGGGSTPFSNTATLASTPLGGTIQTVNRIGP